MNKRPNPFQPTYQPPQPTPPAHPYPPLPPGPPPGNQQQEWAAYWAQQQAAGAAAYSPHAPQQGWPGAAAAPTQAPAQQPAYDPALYRNYGYGGQNAGAQAAWQQARPQAPQAYPTGHPPAYPYPHAAYAQYPGAPAQLSAAPQPMQYGPPYPYPTPPVAMPGQPHAPPPPLPAPMPPPPGPQVGHPPQQHHQPPAKRPRFDSNAQQPNASIPPRPPLPPAPTQPPPLHFKPGGGMVPASQLNTPTPGPSPGGSGTANGQRFGAGSNAPRGGGVPLGLPNRGGGQASRGGRGGGMNAANRPNRGGGPAHGHGAHSGGMGRGGMMGGRGSFGVNGRGPAPRGPPGYRANNTGNRYQNGSFTKSHHQAPMRHDRNRQPGGSSDTSGNRTSSLPGLPSSSFNFTPSNSFRGASPFSGTGKRTLTDFRIVGFGMRPIVDGEGEDTSLTVADLDWTWGTIPGKESDEEPTVNIKTENGEEDSTTVTPEVGVAPPVGASPSSPATKLNRLALSSDGNVTNDASRPPSPIKPQMTGDSSAAFNTSTVELMPPPGSPTSSPNRPTTFKLSSTNSIPVAPRHQRKPHEVSRSETSRIRIYFQCPAELDEKDPNPVQTTPIKGRTWTVDSSHQSTTNGVGVGGKRKKEEDDDDEEREGGKRKRDDSFAGSPAKLNEEPAGSEFEVDMQITGTDDEISTPRPLADGEHPDSAFTNDLNGEPLQSSSMAQDANEDYDAYGEPDVDAEGEYMQSFDEWNEEMSWNAEVHHGVDDLFDGSNSTSPQEPDSKSADASSDLPIQSAELSAPDTRIAGEDRGAADDGISATPLSNSNSQPTGDSSRDASVSGTAEGIKTEVLQTMPASKPEDQGLDTPIKAASPQVVPDAMDSKGEAGHSLKEHDAAVSPALQTGNTPRGPMPSPNRISISYAGSARRLVIDADVIESVKIKRGEGRIDVVLLLDDSTPPQAGPSLSTIKEEDLDGRSPIVGLESEATHDESAKPDTQEVAKPEAHLPTIKSEPQDEPVTSSAPLPTTEVTPSDEPSQESTQAYKPVPHSSHDADRTIPPFPKYLTSGTNKPIRLRLLLYLDKEKPLSEPKWVKTGDIEDWLKTMFGPVKTGPQTYASWSGKISIVDPDPPPNVYALVDSWVQHSMVGPPKERRRFINEHIKSHFDNVFEVLLRMIRREGGQPTSVPSGSPLASALPANSIHASQHTHASLAVLSLYRLTTEYATLAGVDGKTLETRIGQLIRSLPPAQVYKSLDSMFKDWMAVQKKPVNGRGSG
ncbi:hypothetical protein FRB90_011290 [Tulasnella sp. 427]|nr:hypothetical protein FRB90_011290 [Tulasnella sp. 427]